MNRRSVLVGGLLGGAAVVAGCSLNNPLGDEKTPAVEAARDLAPDVALAVSAVSALTATDARARLAATTFPALQGRLAGLLALHEAHLARLRDAVPDGVDATSAATPAAPPTDRRSAVKQVRVDEKALHDQLLGFALRAESGPFARLLGSMAAGVSQQLVVLDR